MDLKPEWRGWFLGNPTLLTLPPLLLPGTPGAQGGPEGVTAAVASALSAGETVRGCCERTLREAVRAHQQGQELILDLLACFCASVPIRQAGKDGCLLGGQVRGGCCSWTAGGLGLG